MKLSGILKKRARYVLYSQRPRKAKQLDVMISMHISIWAHSRESTTDRVIERTCYIKLKTWFRDLHDKL